MLAYIVEQWSNDAVLVLSSAGLRDLLRVVGLGHPRGPNLHSLTCVLPSQCNIVILHAQEKSSTPAIGA